MSFDYELTLIGQTGTSKDDIGNETPGETPTVVYCGKKSVVGTEFYNAAAKGIKPEVVLVVHPYEYGGQTKAIFEGVTYRVVRTYQVNLEELELTCEKVAGNG